MSKSGRTPSAVEVAEALGELECLTECRCDPAWTERGLHAPECASDYRSDVDVLRVALSAPARVHPEVNP